MTPLCYRRHRFPPEIIQHAIWLYLRFTLSYRDVEGSLVTRRWTKGDSNSCDTALLLRELDTLVANDRYFLSPRIQTLKAILAKIRPEPARETLPRPKAPETQTPPGSARPSNRAATLTASPKRLSP
jgi:hypothetical protein